jgi:hypothetical protein
MTETFKHVPFCKFHNMNTNAVNVFNLQHPIQCKECKDLLIVLYTYENKTPKYHSVHLIKRNFEELDNLLEQHEGQISMYSSYTNIDSAFLVNITKDIEDKNGHFTFCDCECIKD